MYAISRHKYLVFNTAPLSSSAAKKSVVTWRNMNMSVMSVTSSLPSTSCLAD